jgi:spore coat polysaccharide biosynthesis predicted glycosyltransferase SpsG
MAAEVAAEPNDTTGHELRVLLVCHAGSGIGLGHLSRTLVVAGALRRELAASVHLLIQGDPLYRDDLSAYDHQFIAGEDSLVDRVLRRTREIDATAVSFDLQTQRVPGDIDRLLRTLKAAGCRIVSVDGLLGGPGQLDLVFIPAFRYSPPPTLADTRVLFGWDCFLLESKHPARDWRPGAKVLALTGGSDATGLGETWPALLDAALPAAAELHWVTGPYARPLVLPGRPRLPIVNHQAPAGLDDLMAKVNYAATVYGVSFFELLYHGVPTVVFSPYGGKDKAELSAIAAEGVALVAEDAASAAASLQTLMADPGLAAELSRRARARLSVSGGQRFARAVAALVA